MALSRRGWSGAGVAAELRPHPQPHPAPSGDGAADRPAAILGLRGVDVRRGGRLVLHGAALTVGRGEVLALVGPNGAGKSTLLHVAALLTVPDAGEVVIDGERVDRRNTPRLRRRLGMVFQAPLLFDVGVLQNAASGVAFRGAGRREAETRARRWLDRFGVAHLAERPARGLSGGEAQRVSLARAFAVEPDVILLDEPFSALDAPTRAALLPELAAQLRDTGTAAIVVTHDQAEALAIGDRLAVMLAGRLAQIGRPEAVVARPAAADVARFLGVANVLPGRIVDRAGGFATVAMLPDGPRLTVSLAPGSAMTVGARVDLALHANAVSVLESGPVPPGRPWNVLAGVVAESRPFPFARRLTVEAGVRLAVEQPLTAAAAVPGEPIRIAIAPDALHPMPAAER